MARFLEEFSSPSYKVIVNRWDSGRTTIHVYEWTYRDLINSQEMVEYGVDDAGGWELVKHCSLPTHSPDEARVAALREVDLHISNQAKNSTASN